MIRHPTGELLELPESYTNVRPLMLPRKDSPIPESDGPVKGDVQVITRALEQESE